MKAIACFHPLPVDHPESLQDIELPRPSPQGRDLLVRVLAVSVNPVDTKMRQAGSLTDQDETPRVLGWDAAGVVEEIGTGVRFFQAGDEIYYSGSLVRPGCNSEFHLVDERIVGAKPTGWSMAQAAALPLTAITAYEALFDRLGIARDRQVNGQAILIIGGAGGVGSIAIQIAKLAGLQVVATASRPESKAWCKAMGADSVIDHTQPLSLQLQALDCSNVGYILNTSSTEQHWKAMAEVIKPQGRLCGIVNANEPVDLNVFKQKSATFSWEFMFTRAMYETEDMIRQHELLNEVAGWIAEGHIQPTLTQTLSPITAANLRQVHAKLEEGHMIGKLVLFDWPS
ncbi:MAG: zinc-binding alcohol dehydrogenase family protein [Nitrospirales bacterium]